MIEDRTTGTGIMHRIYILVNDVLKSDAFRLG